MERTLPPASEAEMAPIVAKLFPNPRFASFEQVPLGRKRIDLVFLKRPCGAVVSVELKIADWKRALWQAALNSQVSDESYIALWHGYVHRALNQSSLLDEYGVGVITVSDDSAEVTRRANRPRRISPKAKAAWYARLLEAGEQAHAALPDISA